MLATVNVLRSVVAAAAYVRSSYHSTVAKLDTLSPRLLASPMCLEDWKCCS
jgi:hypothetical protein